MHELPIVGISSFRPLGANPEIARNQVRAITSWSVAMDGVILFGKPEPLLSSSRTVFVDAPDYPSISLLAYAASQLTVPSCLINADIVVAQHLRWIAGQAWAKRAVAWTSKRCEYDPGTFDLDGAKVVDAGADIFCAMPEVWARVYQAIPGGFRLSAPTWDSWLLGFLTLTFKRRFVDVTALRPIFHPKHGQRIRPALDSIPRDRFIDSGVGFPGLL